MSTSNTATLNLVYAANRVHEHAAMLLSVIRSGEQLSEREEEIIRASLRDLRIASTKAAELGRTR